MESLIVDCVTGAVTTAPAEPIVREIPDVVSARQMKLALLQAGLLDGIETFVMAQDRAVQISWQNATEFSRTDPMLTAMAGAFGLNEEQVDDLFRLAASM